MCRFKTGSRCKVREISQTWLIGDAETLRCAAALTVDRLILVRAVVALVHSFRMSGLRPCIASGAQQRSATPAHPFSFQLSSPKDKHRLVFV